MSKKSQTNIYTISSEAYCSHLVKFQGTLEGEKHCYTYPMLASTVDLIVLSRCGNYAHLVQRSSTTEPTCYRLRWAIPGGFANYNEEFIVGARREFKEETGTDAPEDGVKFLCIADSVDRDPRQRTVSAVYWAVTDMDSDTETICPLDTDEIIEHRWVDLAKVLDGTIQLAFDHTDLINKAVQAYQESKASNDRLESELH